MKKPHAYILRAIVQLGQQMVDAIYLVICFFRRIELNYFSVIISFIITIPPTSIYILDGMLRILGTARVRLFDATHWRFVLRAAYRQQHGWRWQFDSTFRLGRNYLHHTEHAFETGDVFSFETWIISFLDWKKRDVRYLFVLSRDPMSPVIF